MIAALTMRMIDTRRPGHSQLQFVHVVRVLGAAKDTSANGRLRWLLVTEYCALGDLHRLLSNPAHVPHLTDAVLLRMMIQVRVSASCDLP